MFGGGGGTCADSVELTMGAIFGEEMIRNGEEGQSVFTSACSRYADVKSVKVPYNVGDGCVSLTLSLNSWSEGLATQGVRIEDM